MPTAAARCRSHDLIMPNMGGFEATRRIRAQNPSIQVIALTSFDDKSLVQDAIKSGAISFLLKKVTRDDLAAAIRSAYSGHDTLYPEVTREFIFAAQQPQNHRLL